MKRTALFAAVIASLAMQAQGAGIVAKLRPQVEVRGPLVTLDDVALLRSEDLEALRTLMAVPLGPAPAAGTRVLLQREQLEGWIARRARGIAQRIDWHGPVAVQVGAASSWVRGEALVAAAEPALREWLAGQGLEAELAAATPAPDFQAPAGAITLRPRALPAAAVRQRMRVWIDVYGGDRFVRSVPVAFHVALAPAPLAGAPGWKAPSPAAASDAGQTVPTAQAARTAPTTDAGRAPPPVLRGQWALLRSGAGAVLTEARVEVLQDGRIGQSVRVRQPGAAAGVIATVLAPGQLEVTR